MRSQLLQKRLRGASKLCIPVQPSPVPLGPVLWEARPAGGPPAGGSDGVSDERNRRADYRLWSSSTVKDGGRTDVHTELN